MLAVVEIAGKQYEAQPGKVMRSPLLKAKPGQFVSFSKILLASDNQNAKIGAPYIEGSVQAKVLEHGKDETILVFHKKRRKGHRKLNGHRQRFSMLEITGLNIPGFESFGNIVESAPVAVPEEEPQIAESDDEMEFESVENAFDDDAEDTKEENKE